MLLTVGEHYLNDLDDRIIRLSTGFAGGVGGNHLDLCGAYTAGVMILSGLFGRTQPTTDDQLCMKLINEYRQKLIHQLGSIYCWKLREERYGSGNLEPCSSLVSKAAVILMDVLEEQLPP